MMVPRSVNGQRLHAGTYKNVMKSLSMNREATYAGYEKFRGWMLQALHMACSLRCFSSNGNCNLILSGCRAALGGDNKCESDSAAPEC